MNCPKCKAPNPAGSRFCAECGAVLAQAPKPDFGGVPTIDPADSMVRPAPHDTPILAAGAVFADRYEILAVTGQGGMGVVYRAKDTVTEKVVALKLIRADRLAGKDAVKRLIREGVLARDVRHPNVVAVYDIGETQGQPFMSMEFIEGKSLRAWNQQRMRADADCSTATAAKIISEILAGLGAAHAAGVVHRDLKPENVMLLAEPSDAAAPLKILDFGLARAAGGSDTGSTSLGTLEYMAPEQMTAPEAVQPSADFYSLSIIFYELLVSVVPKGHWQPPSGGRSDVPQSIDRLIEKGLSNNPRARPQTAEQYRALLDEALKVGGPTPAKPEPVKPKPPPLMPPRPPKPELAKPAPTPSPPPKEVVLDDNTSSPQPTALKVGKRGRIALIAGGSVIAIVALAFIVPPMINEKWSLPHFFQETFEEMAKPKGESADFDAKMEEIKRLMEVSKTPSGTVNPLPSPPPPPPAPSRPPPSPYAKMSGYWTDDFYNTFQVSVTNNGNVTGRVTAGPMLGINLQGRFTGNNFQYQIANNFQVLGGSTGVFDGGCHIQYALTDAYGNVMGSAQLHINHQPGAPCP